MASQFSSYSKEDLLKKLKSQKTFLAVQAVVVLLMVILAVFTTIEKGVSFQTFLPLFFIPMAFVMYFELKKIKKELSKRK